MKTRLTLLLVVVMVLGALPLTAGAQDAPQLLIWADEDRATVVEELGAAFEEEYGVELVVQQLAFGDIRDQLRIAGPAGEGPDVIVGAHDWLGELVTNGLLAPVDLGDKADGFPGIPRIGAVTAARLLNEHGPIEKIPAAVLDEDRRRDALLFKDLATLRVEPPPFADVEQIRWRGPTDDFPACAEDLGAPRLLERCRKATDPPA